MHGIFTSLAIRVFVDSAWLHKYWGCHRRSDRSFFVEGRQFHVCARCTGLLSGLPVSLALFALGNVALYIFAGFSLLLLADGLTQLAGLRESSNGLRFVTGFAAARHVLAVGAGDRRGALMAEIKTLQFPNTPRGQAEKVRILQWETSQGWRVVSETIIPGKFRGGQACCLFLIFAPCAFLAGHTDDVINVTLQRDVPGEGPGRKTACLRQGEVGGAAAVRPRYRGGSATAARPRPEMDR